MNEINAMNKKGNDGANIRECLLHMEFQIEKRLFRPAASLVLILKQHEKDKFQLVNHIWLHWAKASENLCQQIRKKGCV